MSDNKFSKIEDELAEVLDQCLESMNQDGSIISLSYDSKKEIATVELTVHIVEADGYIGFQGY